MRRKILIVQSDRELAQTIRQGLAADYDVEIAADLPDALARLSAFRPDAILLDLVLRKGSGIHLLDYLLGQEGPVPPVILCGRHKPDPETNPFVHLIAAFLPKPFHLAQLRQKLEEVFTQWRPSPVKPALGGSPRVLVVMADPAEAEALAGRLAEAGARPERAGSFGEARRLLEQERFDVVLSDWSLPDGTGRSLIEQVRVGLPHGADPAPVLIAAENRSPHFARRLFSLGAADLLPKPVQPDLLLIAVERASFRAGPLFRGEKLEAAYRATRAESRRAAGHDRNPYRVRYTADDIIGVSPAMERARQALQQIARMESTVLITGETGTGKELFAHALHHLSPRRNGPFVAVNAAAIPEQLLESELFGYSSGAFTGAKKEGHLGKFRLASGGTLFLDEIGDLSLGLQSKLLRVLQEGEIDPIGGEAPERVDVRLVVATNRNLAAMVREGRFRSDLYFRLNVINITIPPLRERQEDIPVLAEHFLQELCRRYGVPLKRFAPETLEILVAYPWPGNVRELRNAVEHAFVFTPGEVITPADLPAEIRAAPGEGAVPPLQERGGDLSESEMILRALEQAGGNKVKAARLLGISRAGLYIKLKQYGLG